MTIIAIDGPAASGKGTLARSLAVHFGFHHLDTGKIYRAVAKLCLDKNLDPNGFSGQKIISQKLDSIDLQDESLTHENVGSMASKVSGIPSIRKILLEYQQDFARKQPGAVLDGRDIATVICPDADFKFFITANLETRTKRRMKELQSKGIEVIEADLLQEIALRDERDKSREVAPLKPAEDAVIIDTSAISAQSLLQKVIEIINSAN